MKIGESNYIQQLQLHNEKALMYVVDKYGGLLMAVIRRHLFLMPEKQEECFNDVLLKIWQNSSYFDGKKNTFKNWAAAVARYRAIDYLRQYQRELKTISIEDTLVSAEALELSKMIEKELSEETQAMLNCLKEEDRELFLRLYVREESVEQVSRETGIKKEVIYNRVSRGKKKIRRKFSPERGA